jgi:hypothetical protein
MIVNSILVIVVPSAGCPILHFNGLYNPAPAVLARPDRHPLAVDPHAAVNGLIEASMKSSISASISSSRMALAAWSTSIIMARWKWATAPATASRRSSCVSAPSAIVNRPWLSEYAVFGGSMVSTMFAEALKRTDPVVVQRTELHNVHPHELTARSRATFRAASRVTACPLSTSDAGAGEPWPLIRAMTRLNSLPFLMCCLSGMTAVTARIAIARLSRMTARRVWGSKRWAAKSIGGPLRPRVGSFIRPNSRPRPANPRAPA